MSQKVSGCVSASLAPQNALLTLGPSGKDGPSAKAVKSGGRNKSERSVGPCLSKLPCQNRPPQVLLTWDEEERNPRPGNLSDVQMTNGGDSNFISFSCYHRFWAGDLLQSRRYLSGKRSSVHAVSGTGVEHSVTLKHLHPPRKSKTKPNQSTPTLSLFGSHPPNWTNNFSNCVGDTNALAALLPLSCYMIIYFMRNFHRSLAVLLAQLGNLWGSRRPFSFLVFCGLESKSNQDKRPQILPWRKYFKRE